MTQKFSKPARQRLEEFLNGKYSDFYIQQLTPDASTREFFRIVRPKQSMIACIYEEKFDETLPQIDVTNLFLKCGLPVAEILEIDYQNGIILHEDFGDLIMRDHLKKISPEKVEEIINRAISLIARIQNSTPRAFDLDSIASRLKFDREKLLWELDFFKTHYFGSFIGTPLDPDQNRKITSEFEELSGELESFATVLTHRDFHSANLMLDENKNLKIIDHQDARIGSVAYDLVSLLLDRITAVPSEDWLKEKKLYLISQRKELGLKEIGYPDFNYEFELVTVQRCLKAIGTFSNQAGNFNKTHFIQYINPMFQVVLESCRRLNRFPRTRETIQKILA
jgi:aminoglycoside/choline kinase family phosphotransferase